MSVTIKYWALNKKLVFPEASKLSRTKADVGIALPGGGMKAAVLSLGWLQVFHELDLLKRVKYISSVSGGAWTSAPMSNSAATVTMDKFLGNTIPPEQCTIEVMNSFATKPGSHANVLTAAKFTRNLIWDFLTRGFRKDTSDFWAQTVGRIFLEPHGINKNAIGLNERTDLPYQIVNGAIQTGGKRGAVPVEFTPMYYGVPIKHNQRMYNDNNLAFFYRSIDAVYVEPKGFQVKVEKSAISELATDDNGHSISVPATTKIQEFKCKEIVGISSEFFALQLGPKLPQYALPQFIYTALNFPAFQFFNNGVQRFVDGGSSDVTGILALLRRGCTNIVAGIVCDASVNDPVDARDCQKSSFGHYAGLFGVQKSEFAGESSQKYNENRKVFESAKWDDFLAALQAKRRDGEHIIYCYTRNQMVKILPIDFFCLSFTQGSRWYIV
jgi:hypothetical protein